MGWSHSTFGSPLAVVHTRAAAAVVCSSGGACVGLRGHTVWRHVVLHATAPVTAICSEVCEYVQGKAVTALDSCIFKGLSAPFAFAAASLCDVHVCDEVMAEITPAMSRASSRASHQE